MATEQSSQQQHAQWLASLASGHFVQQAVGSITQDAMNQEDSSKAADTDAQIVDMSGHTVVKLISDPAVPAVVQSPSSSPFNLRKNLKRRKLDPDEPEQHAAYKLIRSKERVSAKSFDMRRPVRPIDRQKMRPWLKNLLDTGSVFGLNWLQRDHGIFQISWRHASRLGWNLETDGDVFERWARHTGIYKDGDEPEPKRWKANFRCALHSLPDVKELTSPTDRKGRNASRTYRFLQPHEVQPPVKRKQRYSIQIPYLYERQASEDSGSQQADSDERNTDDEVTVALPEQVQLFPHCDHDYAIRVERQHGDQSTSEILSRHNSGYVLIKSKDAHEFEFRLTPPHGTVQPSSTRKIAPAPSSPQKRGKSNKKKTVSGSSPAKKGKSKLGKKGAGVRKEGKQVKKLKKGSGKEPSPATKVSLRALLSGRKNTASARRAKVGLAANQTNKKAKGGKKAGTAKAKGRGKQERASSGAGTPTQSQGLEALLEAANQIEGMDTRASSTATTSSSTTSRAASKRSAKHAKHTSAAAVRTSHAPSAVDTPVSPVAPSVSAPVMFTTKPVMVASGSAGNTLTPVPVLASVQPAGPPAVLPSQVPLGMLQKFLSLSAVPALPASMPIIIPSQELASSNDGTTAQVATLPTTLPAEVAALPSQVTTLPSQVTAPPLTAHSQVAQSSISEEDVTGKRGKVVVPQAAPAVPTLLVQPEEGTSMLKHLLQLTGPSGAVSTSPGVATNTMATSPVSHIIPPPTSTPHSLVAASGTLDLNLQGASVTDAGLLNMELAAAETIAETKPGVNSITGQSCQVSEEFELGSSQEATSIKSEENFAESNLVKTDLQIEGSETEAAMPDRSMATVGSTSASQPQLSAGGPANLGPDLQLCDGTQAGVPSPHTLPVAASVPQALAPPPQAAAAALPQVTLCLPQGLSGALPQQVFGGGAQTMTLTLPQASNPLSQGQGSSTATFTHSMDLLQFLNLCAASGNGQVIIKTEPPVASDVAAMSNAYCPEKAASSSQAEGDASVGAKFIVLNTSMQTQGTVSAQPGGNPLEEAGGHESQISPASAAVTSSLTPTYDDSLTFSAAEDGQGLSATVQCPATSAGLEPYTEPAFEGGPVQTVTVSTLSETASQPALVHTAQVEEQTDVRSASNMEAVSHQFTMSEVDVPSLSTDQHGAESFVVEDMLL